MKEGMVTDNSRERLTVQNKDDWSKKLPLRDTKLDNNWEEFRAIDKNCLVAVEEVGVEPGDNRTRKTTSSVHSGQYPPAPIVASTPKR